MHDTNKKEKGHTQIIRNRYTNINACVYTDRDRDTGTDTDTDTQTSTPRQKTPSKKKNLQEGQRRKAMRKVGLK